MAAANAYERMSKRRERVKDMTAQSRKPLNYSLKRRSPSLSKDNGDSLSHSSTEEVNEYVLKCNDFYFHFHLSLSRSAQYRHIVLMCLEFMILTRKKSKSI